jgi:hypothetical protein
MAAPQKPGLGSLCFIIGRLPLDTEASVQIFERVVLDWRGRAVVERC